MNVLFIAGWYPNSTFKYQGIFSKKHAHAIKAAGVNIKVLALTVNHSKKVLEFKSDSFTDEAGVETLLLEINSRFYKLFLVSMPLLNFIAKRNFKKHFSKFKPDVIHSNVLFPAGLLGAKLASDLNLPHVITEHWSKAAAFMENGWFAKSAIMACANAKAVMPVSNYLAKKIEKYIDSQKLIVVPNTVNTSVFKPISKKEKDNEIVFACLANWQNPKRPDLIFEALNVFSKTLNKKIRLKSIGGGALIQPLKNRKWNFEVEFYNFVEAETIVNLFEDVDYLLHASEDETFSIILAEAGVMGIPMAASNKGAMPELVNSTNGVLTENTIEDWVKAIEKLTASSYNREQISEEMKKLTSYEAVGSKYKEIYSGIVNR